jgi:transposase
MLGGHFHMGRKSKYSADFKLMIIHEAETLGITRTSMKYSISDHTIRTWKLIYKYQGIPGLKPTHSNNTYSREYKESLVEEYQKSDEKLEEFSIRHRMRDRTQINQL